MYSRVMALREINPDLKVVLAVGGWNHGGAPFTAVVEDPATMAEFVRQTHAFVARHGFDGFDLDWEYPGSVERGSLPVDKQRFTRFVREFRRVFGEHLLLTAAVGVGKETIENGKLEIFRLPYSVWV